MKQVTGIALMLLSIPGIAWAGLEAKTGSRLAGQGGTARRGNDPEKDPALA